MEDYFCRHRYHAPVSRPIDRPLTSKPSREGYWEGGRRVTRRVHFCDQVYPASGRGASPSAWGYYFAYIQVAIPYTVARLGNRWTKINTCDETLSLSPPPLFLSSFSLRFNLCLSSSRHPCFPRESTNFSTVTFFFSRVAVAKSPIPGCIAPGELLDRDEARRERRKKERKEWWEDGRGWIFRLIQRDQFVPGLVISIVPPSVRT